jgi:hypothetical protein
MPVVPREGCEWVDLPVMWAVRRYRAQTGGFRGGKAVDGEQQRRLDEMTALFGSVVAGGDAVRNGTISRHLIRERNRGDGAERCARPRKPPEKAGAARATRAEWEFRFWLAQQAVSLVFRLVLIIWVIAVIFGLLHAGQAMCDAPPWGASIPIGMVHAAADWLLSFRA